MSMYGFKYEPVLSSFKMNLMFHYDVYCNRYPYDFMYRRIANLFDTRYVNSPVAIQKAASGLFYDISWTMIGVTPIRYIDVLREGKQLRKIHSADEHAIGRFLKFGGVTSGYTPQPEDIHNNSNIKSIYAYKDTHIGRFDNNTNEVPVLFVTPLTHKEINPIENVFAGKFINEAFTSVAGMAWMDSNDTNDYEMIWANKADPVVNFIPIEFARKDDPAGFYMSENLAHKDNPIANAFPIENAKNLRETIVNFFEQVYAKYPDIYHAFSFDMEPFTKENHYSLFNKILQLKKENGVLNRIENIQTFKDIVYGYIGKDFVAFKKGAEGMYDSILSGVVSNRSAFEKGSSISAILPNKHSNYFENISVGTPNRFSNTYENIHAWKPNGEISADKEQNLQAWRDINRVMRIDIITAFRDIFNLMMNRNIDMAGLPNKYVSDFEQVYITSPIKNTSVFDDISGSQKERPDVTYLSDFDALTAPIKKVYTEDSVYAYKQSPLVSVDDYILQGKKDNIYVDLHKDEFVYKKTSGTVYFNRILALTNTYKDLFINRDLFGWKHGISGQSFGDDDIMAKATPKDAFITDIYSGSISRKNAWQDPGVFIQKLVITADAPEHEMLKKDFVNFNSFDSGISIDKQVKIINIMANNIGAYRPIIEVTPYVHDSGSVRERYEIMPTDTFEPIYRKNKSVAQWNQTWAYYPERKIGFWPEMLTIYKKSRIIMQNNFTDEFVSKTVPGYVYWQQPEAADRDNRYSFAYDSTIFTNKGVKEVIMTFMETFSMNGKRIFAEDKNLSVAKSAIDVIDFDYTVVNKAFPRDVWVNDNTFVHVSGKDVNVFNDIGVLFAGKAGRTVVDFRNLLWGLKTNIDVWETSGDFAYKGYHSVFFDDTTAGLWKAHTVVNDFHGIVPVGKMPKDVAWLYQEWIYKNITSDNHGLRYYGRDLWAEKTRKGVNLYEQLWAEKTKYRVWLNDTTEFAQKQKYELSSIPNGWFVYKLQKKIFLDDKTGFIDKVYGDLVLYKADRVVTKVKYGLDVDKDNIQATKIKYKVFLDDTQTSLTKDNTGVTINEDSFAYKLLKRLSLWDEYEISGGYKDRYSFVMHNDESAEKIRHDLAFFNQIWAYHSKKSLEVYEQQFMAWHAPKHIMTDDDIAWAVKAKITYKTWEMIQGHDILAVTKDPKEATVQYFIDTFKKVKKHARLNYDAISSVIPKHGKMINGIELFCDKDAHRTFIDYENEWYIKDRILGMISHDDWITKGPKKAQIDYEHEWYTIQKYGALWYNIPTWFTMQAGTGIIESGDWATMELHKTMLDYEDEWITSQHFGQYLTKEDFADKLSKNAQMTSIEWLDRDDRYVHILDIDSAKVPQRTGGYIKGYVPIERLNYNATYREIDTVYRKYYDLGIHPDDFGNWAWVYETPDPFENDPFGIDELLLPENDTRYEDFENLIFNRKTQRPRNPVKKIDDNTWIAKLPSKHPFKNFYETEGNVYVGVKFEQYFGVRTSIMHAIFLKYYQIWQTHIFEFATMTMHQSTKMMLEYLYSWIHIYFPTDELDEALRVFRQVRWYSERAILNNAQYVVSGEWGNLPFTEMENNLKGNDTMYYDEKNGVIRNNPAYVGATEASVEFYVDVWKNTTLKFSLINNVGSVNIYIDGVLVDVLSKNTLNAIYPLNYTGDIITIRFEKTKECNLNDQFMIGAMSIAGIKFDKLEVDFDPTLKAGNKPMAEIVKKMLEYANLHDDATAAYEHIRKTNLGVSVTMDMLLEYWKYHHEDKIKGKRLTIKEV